MHYLKRIPRKNGEDGISPVVGVMLMLVVTIIIAAVVSAFAGGAVGGSQKAPNANMEVHIKNGGTNSTSYFSMKVLGVSDPIPTKSLQLTTSWTTADKDPSSSTYQTSVTGGGIANKTAAAYVTGDLVAGTTAFSVPTGYGNLVKNVSNDTYHTPEAQWGNFTLSSGTSTFDRPGTTYGTGTGGSYFYGASTTTPSSTYDPMQVILGRNWSFLRSGDTVSVRLIDTASGKTIVDQNVVVEGP